MKKVLVLLALHIGVALKQSLGISLEVQEDLSAKSIADAQRLVQEQLRGSVASCKDFTCSDGWTPKPDHGELKGSSDALCCQQTCQLFTCGMGYVANKSYAKNVGSTAGQCCDKTCHGFSCPKHLQVAPQMLNKAGNTVEECCAETCSEVTCEANYAKKNELKDKVHPPGEAQSFCCAETCALHTCGKNMAPDEDRLLDIVPSDAKQHQLPCWKGSTTHQGGQSAGDRRQVLRHRVCWLHLWQGMASGSLEGHQVWKHRPGLLYKNLCQVRVQRWLGPEP